MSLKTVYSSKALFTRCTGELSEIYQPEEARQISKLLFSDLLNISFEKIMMDEQISLDDKQIKQFEQSVIDLRNHRPIQYVLGKAHFYGRDFLVNHHVLIPRQETEELVREIIIDHKRSGLQILDIGSGSGCIGIILALEMPESTVTLLDVSGDALDISRENAHRFNANCNLIEGDILNMQSLPSKYDIIVSNPPYVTESEKALMHRNVLMHEPGRALFVPDHDPLVFYQKIASLASGSLTPRGRLYLEINERFGWEVIRICESAGFSSVVLLKDLNGKDRMVKAAL